MSGRIVPTLGTYVPQGVALGADVVLDGTLNIPTPTYLDEKPPTRVGTYLSGAPAFMGLPDRTLTWEWMTIDEWQALRVLFDTKLALIGDDRLITVTWPDPDQAGKYVEFRAFMDWPVRGRWSPPGVFVGSSLVLLKCRYPGQGALG